jgi:GH15 family glucan-1,4-alpha-glucosidase
MDLAGEHDSAAKFHEWASGTVNSRRNVIARAVEKGKRGEPLRPGEYLHTRYSANGQEASGTDWPDFQLDGFGTWLWALRQHARRVGGRLPENWSQAAAHIAHYLQTLWAQPCYDCWEESPDRVHTYTLAAIYGGLKACGEWAGNDVHPTLDAIQNYLRDHAVAEGRLVKSSGSMEIDASLVGAAAPYEAFGLDDPVVRATVRQIESRLRKGGGVHRYPGDTYYGGGEWILLTAWVGWYYAQVGERDKALEALQWVEAQVDTEGHLPEQVPAHLNQPEAYGTWRRRWGDIARPLLWSHAKYIILSHHLKQTAGE